MVSSFNLQSLVFFIPWVQESRLQLPVPDDKEVEEAKLRDDHVEVTNLNGILANTLVLTKIPFEVI